MKCCIFFIAVCFTFSVSYSQCIYQELASAEGYKEYASLFSDLSDSLNYYRGSIRNNLLPAERKTVNERYLFWKEVYKQKLTEYVAANASKEVAAVAVLASRYMQSNADFPLADSLAHLLTADGRTNKFAEALFAIIDAKKRVAANHIADFTLPDNSGKNISLSSVKDKFIVLNFWASWCKPCRLKNAQLKIIYEQYRNKGLNVVAVSLDTDVASWQKALQNDKLNWINLMAEDGFQSMAAISYGVYSVPKTYLLDAGGNILASNLEVSALIKFLEK